MLRTAFVAFIIVFGGIYAVQGPFNFLLFYLWYAYFRPDAWIFWLSWVQNLNLSLILGTAVLLTTAASVPKIRFNNSVVVMLLFLAQSLIATIFSPHADVSWSSWFVFVRVWLISYAIILLVTDRDRFRLALLVIALSLGFEGAKQGWVGFILNPAASNSNPLPFLGDNNGVAVGMMMLVPIFGALAQTATRPWERWVYWFFGAGVFLRGLTTYSRGGFLSAIVLVAVYWINSRTKIRTLIGIAIVGGVVLSAMPQQFWDRMHTITAPASERDESARGRVYFWEVATRMAAANPILGVGFDGFEASYNEYDTSRGEFGGDRAVHSTWFGVLADTGYVGASLFVSLFVITLFNLARLRSAAGWDGADTAAPIYARALLTSLLSFSIGGTFVNLQYNEMFWHFIALGAALKVIADRPSPVAEPARVIQSPGYALNPSSSRL